MTTENDSTVQDFVKELIIGHLRNLGNEDSIASLKDMPINDLLFDLIIFAKRKGYNEAISNMKHGLEKMSGR